MTWQVLKQLLNRLRGSRKVTLTLIGSLLREERKAVSLNIMLCLSIKGALTHGNVIYFIMEYSF